MGRGTSTGCSLGGTIIRFRREKNKKSKKYKESLKNIKKCNKCVNFRKGYCKKFSMRPTTLELADICKSFEAKPKKKKEKKTEDEKILNGSVECKITIK